MNISPKVDSMSCCELNLAHFAQIKTKKPLRFQFKWKQAGSHYKIYSLQACGTNFKKLNECSHFFCLTSLVDKSSFTPAVLGQSDLLLLKALQGMNDSGFGTKTKVNKPLKKITREGEMMCVWHESSNSIPHCQFYVVLFWRVRKPP